MIKNVEIELKHIQLELNNNRTQHLRHFIDQYFCYKHGYVNKSGKAKWDDIFWNETVSIAASKTRTKGDVVKEHVVPLKHITSELVKLVKPEGVSLVEIADCLDELLHFATITKEEDKLLRQAKLHSRMPDEYFQKNSALYKDVFARYKIVNIRY